MSEVLDALALVIAKRRAADPNESYVASLNAKGLNKILEKVGEEAVEVVIAAKDAELAEASNDRVINEVADLVFHTLVMLDPSGRCWRWAWTHQRRICKNQRNKLIARPTGYGRCESQRKRIIGGKTMELDFNA